MIARFFDRDGCIVGLRFVTYAKLEQWYVCNWCGGRIVHRFTQDRDEAFCGECKSENFIPQWLFDKQIAEGPAIISTLPAQVRELFRITEPVTADQAIAELFG